MIENTERCKRCRRTKQELFDLDIEVRQIGNPHFPEWICDDCLFSGQVIG